MTRATVAGGVGLATLLAGPVFVATIFVGGWIDGERFSPGFAAALGMAMFAIPFGAILAFLPNLIGARLMATGGCHNVALRLPVMWLLIGGAAGAAIGWSFDPSGTNQTTAAMACVGAMCAGLCRLFTRWDD